MTRPIMSMEARTTLKTNLELELTVRKEKLVAMCEAQCASLRSKLERRVNRVPNNKRHIIIADCIEPAGPQKIATGIKKKTITSVPTKASGKAFAKGSTKAPVPTPAPALSNRRTRPAPATTSQAPGQTAKAAPKSSRVAKRTSDEMSEDKENNDAELTVPKKRVKAATTSTTTRPIRSTRAASRKIDSTPQILSPKTNNSRPAPQTRTRRQR